MKEVLNSVLDYLIDVRKLHELVDTQRKAFDKQDIIAELSARLEEETLRSKVLSLEELRGLKDTLNKE